MGTMYFNHPITQADGFKTTSPAYVHKIIDTEAQAVLELAQLIRDFKTRYPKYVVSEAKWPGYVTVTNPELRPANQTIATFWWTDKQPLGYRVRVMRSADFPDCTENGLSARFNRLTLVGKGLPEQDAVGVDAPLMQLVYRDYINHWYVRPIGYWNQDSHMAGGNFAWTTDSRMPFQYPVEIHDRKEFDRP